MPYTILKCLSNNEFKIEIYIFSNKKSAKSQPNHLFKSYTCILVIGRERCDVADCIWKIDQFNFFVNVFSQSSNTSICHAI